MRTKILLFIGFLSSLTFLQAQELSVDVTINTPKVQTTDLKIFENMETAIEEFMNNQKWTRDVFEIEERIRCQIQLTITAENGNNSFAAEMGIVASRPIFGSNEETAILTHVDKDVQFEYELFQPLQFSENNFNNNLTSILGFYAYIILGLDYDSFEAFGGEQHFITANNIINQIPPNVANSFKGWRSVESNRNRYWIIENYMNPRMRGFRQAMYDYHRHGLDMMHNNADFGRAKIYTAILELEKANKSYPNAMILQMFSNAKNRELVEIFKEGTISEKPKVHAIMTKIDAANARKYLPLSR